MGFVRAVPKRTHSQDFKYRHIGRIKKYTDVAKGNEVKDMTEQEQRAAGSPSLSVPVLSHFIMLRLQYVTG